MTWFDRPAFWTRLGSLSPIQDPSSIVAVKIPPPLSSPDLCITPLSQFPSYPSRIPAVEFTADLGRRRRSPRCLRRDLIPTEWTKRRWLTLTLGFCRRSCRRMLCFWSASRRPRADPAVCTWSELLTFPRWATLPVGFSFCLFGFSYRFYFILKLGLSFVWKELGFLIWFGN